MAKLQTDTGNVQVTITGEQEGDGLVLRNGVYVNERVAIAGVNALTQTLTVELTSDQAVATAGATVTWDQVDSDSTAPSSAWSSTNGDRLVAWITGWYIVTISLEWETTATADRYASFSRNSDSKSFAHSRFDAAGTNYQPATNNSAPVYLEANDYITVFAGHDDGVNRNLKAGAHTRATMTLLDDGSLVAGWSPILDYKPTTDTPDDEFDSTTLDGKWTAVSGTAGTVNPFETGEVEKYDLTTRPGWLLMQAGSAANQKVELRQDFTLADGDSVILAISPVTSSDGDTGIANNELWTGLVLNDNDTGYDAGEWNGILFDVNADGWRILNFDGTTVHGATGTNSASMGSPIAQVIYLRYMRSGSVVYGFWSHDGSSWMSLGSETRSATATNIWIVAESVAAASEPVPIIAVDWIRQGTNNLDPWPHSGLVQLDTVPEWMTALAGRVAGETAHADDDFFGADSSGDYTTQTVSGTASWSIGRGLLSAYADNQTASDASAYLKSITSASAPMTIETRMTWTHPEDDFPRCGIMFTDGTATTSNCVINCMQGSDVDLEGKTFKVSAGTLTNIQADVSVDYFGGSTSNFHLSDQGVWYMRLIWKSSNTWQASFSLDGVQWFNDGMANQSKTMTPTHVGFLLTTSGMNQTYFAKFDYLRVYDSDLSV